MILKKAWQALFILTFSIYFLPAQVSFLEDNFYNQIVIDKGLVHPVGIAFDDNGIGYIWQKKGIVKLLDTNGKMLDKPLIDISEEGNWEWRPRFIGLCT